MPVLAALSDAERIDWLRLSRSEGIGPRTFVGLIQRCGSAAAALEALPRLAKRPVVVGTREAALRELEAAGRRNCVIVGLNEPEYPPALRMIESAPPVLTVRGKLPILQKPMVALVGSRNASGTGLLFTERLASGIGAAGFPVVSGLARGIDAQAHRATLSTGTVAVLAGGHDRIYPSDHAGLAETIAETGAIVSEMPLGWVPRGRDFPRRNRIVSGIAMATVVIEAARRSGSLITARFANEQGREVFAVPGSPLDPRAEGTNDLLRHGATLCTGVDDVVESLRTMSGLHETAPYPRLALWDQAFDGSGTEEPLLGDGEDGGDLARVKHLLGPAPIALDDLVRLSGLNAGRLRTVLLDLELTGEAVVEGGSITGSSLP